MPPARPAIDRLLEKVRYDGGCWIFTGARDNKGYGRINALARSRPAHRVAYDLLVGHVHPSMHIDHVCRNTSCCNPLHLEPVMPSVNHSRGIAPLHQRKKTHCPKGHEYTPENTRLKDGRRRECRECGRIYERKKTAARRLIREVKSA